MRNLATEALTSELQKKIALGHIFTQVFDGRPKRKSSYRTPHERIVKNDWFGIVFTQVDTYSAYGRSGEIWCKSYTVMQNMGSHAWHKCIRTLKMQVSVGGASYIYIWCVCSFVFSFISYMLSFVCDINSICCKCSCFPAYPAAS